jgi:hypothetical protein
MSTECGGCKGIGSHKHLCPQRPGYHRYDPLIEVADDLGDRLSGIDNALANGAWHIGGVLRQLKVKHEGERE